LNSRSAKRYGARVALFGRKINAAEHQLSFVVTVGSNGCYYTSGTNSSIIHFPAFKVETSTQTVAAALSMEPLRSP